MTNYSYLNTITFNISIRYPIIIGYYNINTVIVQLARHTKTRIFCALSEHASSQILYIF